MKKSKCCSSLTFLRPSCRESSGPAPWNPTTSSLMLPTPQTGEGSYVV